MNDSAFFSYKGGYILKSIQGNKISFKKILARYTFKEEYDSFKSCSLDDDLTLSISLSSELPTSKIVLYAIKTMSLILGSSLNLKVDIQDRRKEKDEYELLVAVCAAINEMLEVPMNKNKLLSKIILASNLDKDLLKEKYQLIKLDQLTKWSIEEEYIKLEKNSILDKISNFKTADIKAVKASHNSKIEASSNLQGVYKCFFGIDEDI